MDYGCIVYGAASTATLRSLDVVADEALRTTSGAFKTTHVSSLLVLNNEAPLELRRAELLLKYYNKSKCSLTYGQRTLIYGKFTSIWEVQLLDV